MLYTSKVSIVRKLSDDDEKALSDLIPELKLRTKKWSFNLFNRAKFQQLKKKINMKYKEFFYKLPKMRYYSLSYDLVEFIYPRIIEFRNSKIHSYPSCLQRNKENNDDTSEAIDQMLENNFARNIDSFDCKELREWKSILDEIIFSFEHYLYTNTKEFWIKYYGESPCDEKDKNKYIRYIYYGGKDQEGNAYWKISENVRLSNDECLGVERAYELMAIKEGYCNEQLEEQASERAAHGWELFGKYFLDFFD